MGERYTRYHEKRLGYFQQTALDSRGNTLTHQDLKELFIKEGDKEALQGLEFKPKLWAIVSSLYWGGALPLYIAFKIDERGGQQDLVQEAKFPWILLSALVITNAGFNLFNKNITSEIYAIKVYDTNLLKRLGIPISNPAIY